MGTFFKKIRFYLNRLEGMGISIHASHACYFMVLSAFPALLLAVGLLRHTPLEASDLMALLEGSLPDALEPYLWTIVSGAFERPPRAVVPLSVALTLWSAGRGMHGLLTGLNSVYGVPEKRNWLQIRLTSVFYTVLFLVVLVLTALLHVFRLRVSWLSWGFPGVVLMQTLLLAAMFMFLPGRRNGFRESLPGALFGSLGWMTFSGLFSVYVDHFDRYTNIYGSVYGLALAMLWLYMCVSIVFYGGVLNRFLKEKGKL